jgi:hypothetical protein
MYPQGDLNAREDLTVARVRAERSMSAEMEDKAKIAYLEEQLKAAKLLIAAQEKVIDDKNRMLTKMRELFRGITYIANYVARRTIIEMAEVGEKVPDGN